MSECTDTILAVDEVSTRLEVVQRTVYRLAACGVIPAFKLGGTWRFRRADPEAGIAQRSRTALHAQVAGGVKD